MLLLALAAVSSTGQSRSTVEAPAEPPQRAAREMHAAPQRRPAKLRRGGLTVAVQISLSASWFWGRRWEKDEVAVVHVSLTPPAAATAGALSRWRENELGFPFPVNSSLYS